MQPDEALKNLSELYLNKNKDYKDCYKKHGHVIEALFPDGITLENYTDMNRFALLDMMVGKLTRYCNNFFEDGHKDSLDDISVYAQMLNEIDQDSDNNYE